MMNESNNQVLHIVDELIPYDKNSRTHSEVQIDQLADSIDEFGFVGAIVIRDGVIAKGHGCVEAIKLLLNKGKDIYPAPGQKAGAEHFTKDNPISTIDATGWTDEQFKAYVITDNQLALNAGWNIELLKTELKYLELASFPIELIGFESNYLKDLLGTLNFTPGTAGDQSKLDQLDPVMVTCPSCGTEFDMRKQDDEKIEN